jgi:hypothetical protein
MKTYHNEGNSSGITKIAWKLFLEFFLNKVNKFKSEKQFVTKCSTGKQNFGSKLAGMG